MADNWPAGHTEKEVDRVALFAYNEHMMQQPNTIPEFVEACKMLDNDGIYTLFNNVISDSLRDEILICHADPESPEPTRSAMEALGLKFNVQSLIDY